MKYISFLFYLLFSIFFISCKPDSTTSVTDSLTPFDIPVYQYSENNYLLDTSYGRSFENYELNGNSDINITKVEVWVYCDPADSTGRIGVGFRDVLPRPTGGYGTVFEGDSSGYRRIGRFKKLNSSEFTLNPRAGYITIKNFQPVSPKDVILASYIVTNGFQTSQYGDFADEVSPDSLLTLKLIRDRSQQSPRQNSAYSVIWSLMMKNIYRIGVTNLSNDPDKLTNFRVVKSLPGISDLNSYIGFTPPINWANGKGYMYLTGIDKKFNGYPNDTVRAGDGLFDFFPGATIDLETGSIIFPTLKPFSTYMMGKGVPADSLNANDSIYYNSIGTLTNGNYPIYFRIKGAIKN